MNLPLLEKKIGVRFKSASLLQQAVTHRSYSNEHRDEGAEHNERLEFLGDAVLELIISDHLFDRFPDKEEGALTELRSALVKGTTLTAVAETLDLDRHVRLSRGERNDTKSRGQILANALEALVGALYKDQGFEAARAFVEKYFFPRLEHISIADLKDSKSRLQEIIQEKVRITPHYRVLSESGPDHEKRFVVGVCLGEEVVARGVGPSKQVAQQEAAKNALNAL